MEVVYAAEKPTIADVLSDRLHLRIEPDEIEVHDNPEETGSFLVDSRHGRYILSPSGGVAPTVGDAIESRSFGDPA